MHVMGTDVVALIASTATAAIALNAIGMLLAKGGARRSPVERAFEDAEQAATLAGRTPPSPGARGWDPAASALAIAGGPAAT